MRVISGKHKSKPIETVAGQNTRPTMDKVKEGIFNSLYNFEGEIEGEILDLFAGSGSLGIEALSRGASSAIFVDQNSHAIKIIHRNLKRLDLSSQAEVYKNNADRALKALNKREIQFDIIFLDPPYDKGIIDNVLKRIAEFDLLKENGTIVCEFSHQEQIDFASFEVIKTYHYGLTDTAILKKGEQHG